LFYFLQLDNWLLALKCNRSFGQQIKKAWYKTRPKSL
jgi:hypothetical protein